jgi:hypothetical protein
MIITLLKFLTSLPYFIIVILVCSSTVADRFNRCSQEHACLRSGPFKLSRRFVFLATTSRHVAPWVIQHLALNLAEPPSTCGWVDQTILDLATDPRIAQTHLYEATILINGRSRIVHCISKHTRSIDKS